MNLDFSSPPPASGLDILVCGAGPAGLVAALRLAQKGYAVALFDKRDPWREPVSCAEAVNTRGLHKLVEVDPAWIRGHLDGVDFVSPNQTRIRYRQDKAGLILDRALMHKGLAERCAAAGVHCHFRAEVQSLGTPTPQGRTAIVQIQGEVRTVQAKVIIDATGPGGKLTRGEPLTDGKFDLEPAVFALVDGLEHDPKFIEMYFHSKHFPGGYGWLFPRDGKTANVGLVVGREFTRDLPPRELLKRWVAEVWPTASVKEIFGGAIACGQSSDPLGHGRVIKAGDSANMVNPISRSGILEAMRGGKLAAECAESILKGEPESRAYQHYAEAWKNAYGNPHSRLARAKRGFGQIPDHVFDKAAARILKIPEAKRTLPRIFLATLLGSPGLLWRMRSLMW